MKRIFLILLFFSFGLFSQDEVMDKFFKLSEEVITPHINWAKPYKKRVKILFITLKVKGRGIIELSQRMDLDYEWFSFLVSRSITPALHYYGFDKEFIFNNSFTNLFSVKLQIVKKNYCGIQLRLCIKFLLMTLNIK